MTVSVFFKWGFQYLHIGVWLLPHMVSGVFLYRLCTAFVQVKRGWYWKAVLYGVLMGASGMIIWVGDNNLLMTLPVFLVLFFLGTQGDWTGRAAIAVILFCLIMSVCAMIDTYIVFLIGVQDIYDAVTRLLRPPVFGLAWLMLRKHLPKGPVQLSGRLRRLILALAAMPLCAMMAVVLLTYERYDYKEVHDLALSQGIVVLPFVFLTAMMLLIAVTVLADQERLERAAGLADLRESYYQGLRREEYHLRAFRHDLRNHLTALRGLLEEGEPQRALHYVNQMADSPALSAGRRLCGNETANAVLSAKAADMERVGVTGEFAVSLPEELPVADIDLCALLGNALDNAIEAAAQAAEKRVVVRCRVEKGLFMLRVENTAGESRKDLATTKPDAANHGFGIPGMREIAERYGGSLEASAREGWFELVVCLPLA